MIVMTKMKINKLFQIGSHVLAYSNSCVNPILYAYFSTPFRNAFIKLFGRKQNNNTRWAFSGCQWTKTALWVSLINDNLIYFVQIHIYRKTQSLLWVKQVLLLPLTHKIASNLFSQ